MPASAKTTTSGPPSGAPRATTLTPGRAARTASTAPAASGSAMSRSTTSQPSWTASTASMPLAAVRVSLTSGSALSAPATPSR